MTFDESTPVPDHFKDGDSMMLSFAHLTKGLKRNRDTPATMFQYNVAAAIEVGFKGREYHWLPRDVADYVIERSNNHQDAAIKTHTWISRIKKLKNTCEPSFEKFKTSPKFNLNLSALPEAGPGSMLHMKYDFVCQHWSGLVEGVTDLKELSTVTTRLSKFNLIEKLEQHAGLHCDFQHADSEAKQVTRSLLVLTQTFQDIYFNSIPKSDFDMMFLIASRSTYKNLGPVPMWYVRTPADLVRLSHILKADMGKSEAYTVQGVDTKKDKTRKGDAGDAEKEPKGPKIESKGPDEKEPKIESKGSVKRVRGKAAIERGEQVKVLNVAASETMVLKIQPTGAPERNKFWLEDTLTCLNSGVANVAQQHHKQAVREDAALFCWRWAVCYPNPTTWYGTEYKQTWIPVRKAAKTHVAKVHEATVMAEDADRTLNVLVQELSDTKEADPVWVIKLRNLEVKLMIVSLLQCNSPNAAGPRPGRPCAEHVRDILKSSDNTQDFLSQTFDYFEKVYPPDVRLVTKNMSSYCKVARTLHPDAAGIINSMSELALLVDMRGRSIVDAMRNPLAKEDLQRLRLEPQSQAIIDHCDMIAPVDCAIDSKPNWTSVWALLLAPINQPSDFSRHLDAMTLIAKPVKVTTEASAPQQSSASSGADSKSVNQHNQHGSRDTAVVPLSMHFLDCSLVCELPSDDESLPIIQTAKAKAKARAATIAAAKANSDPNEPPAKKQKEEEGTPEDSLAEAAQAAAAAGAADAAEADEKLIELVPMRVVSDFVDQLAMEIRNLFYQKDNTDVGYSYLGTMPDATASQIATRKQHLVTLCAPRSSIRLAFIGPVTYVPKEGHIMVARMWGQQFFISPHDEIDSGHFYPAWLLKCVRTPTNKHILQ